MFKETPKKIISPQNPIIKHLIKLRENAQYRQKEGSVLISGLKLVKEIESITSPIRIFSEKPLLSPHILVSKSVMKKITALPSPEGIAAEFSLPIPSSLENHAPLLVLDQITDPGNMGTLIRTALALGWKGVFFLPGCVDPFHKKVIRSSCAALFRFPWKEGSWEELKKLKLTPYIANIKGCSIEELSPKKEILLLLSNEANGVSKQSKRFGEHITIPMPGEMESLNVAISGAIIMYQLGRTLS